MLQFLTASYSQLLGAGLVLTIVVFAVYLLRRRMEDHRAKHKLADYTRLELHVPQLAAPGDRPRHLHRQRVVYQRLPGGDNPRAGRRRGDADQRLELHRPRQVRGRVPGRRHQAGLRHRPSAASICRRSTSSSRPAGPGVHIVGELGGMGLIKNALTQGLQVAAHLQADRSDGHAALAGAVSTWRSSARARPGIATARRRRSRRALVRAAGAGHGRRHDRPLPAAEGGHDREGRPAVPSAGSGAADLARRSCSPRWSRSSPGRASRIHEGAKVTGVDGETGDFLVTTVARRPAARGGWCWRSAGAARRARWACPARICPRSPTG